MKISISYGMPLLGFINGGMKEKRKEQAGAELCQAQVKLGWPASLISL